MCMKINQFKSTELRECLECVLSPSSVLFFWFNNVVVLLLRVLLASKERRSVIYTILCEIFIGDQQFVCMFAVGKEFLMSPFMGNRRFTFQKKQLQTLVLHLC